MAKSYSNSYKEAGVDVTAGYRSVELIKSHVKRTNIPGVIGDLGGFGGLFSPDLTGMKKPVFVSGTDGVGTKLALAIKMDKHDTVGIDCVAMCVNDVVCAGAKPLFFLDYIACGKNIPERIEAIVKGIADGCCESGCALIGGETAEMPGFYPENEYDMAGFTVGVVDEEDILDKKNVKVGDKIVGLASSGVHSNGFSLVRKVFDIDHDDKVLYEYEERLGRPLGEVLLEPTKLYVKPALELLNGVRVHSIAHVTGGGFYENLPRAFNDDQNAFIYKGSWEIPEIFNLLQEKGNISEHDMFNTFNMGIGMAVIMDAADAHKAVEMMIACNVKASIIGEITEGDHSVVFGE